MDGNAPRVGPVSRPNYGIEKAGGQGQNRKKDQTPFTLEEKDREEGKPTASPDQGSGTLEEELEISPPKEGEAGGKLNVVA